MKKFLVMGLLGVLGVRAAEEKFSTAVRPEDFTAAGLAKLTPAELARLDALVRDYQSGALLAAKREAETAEQARLAAEARAAQAAADARTTQLAAAAQTAKAPERKSDGGLLAKARALLPAGTEVEYAAIESRIAGDFTGWEGRTVFALENGQRWRVANSGESYYTPAVKNPAVKITPASLGGFWMTVEGVKQRVRVVRVDTGS